MITRTIVLTLHITAIASWLGAEIVQHATRLRWQKETPEATIRLLRSSWTQDGPAAIASQSEAMRAQTDDGWLNGGSAPMLVVQGVVDRIAPPENGHRLRDRAPERIQVVDIPRAGHAVLNERPQAVAAAIIDVVTVGLH